jgi:hypothetical protein
MKRVLLLAAAALTLTAFVPEQADAQVRRFGVRGPVVVGRGPVYAYPRGYYGYRRGYYGPGLGAAVGLGILGGAALGAATAAPFTGTRACVSSRSSTPGAMPVNLRSRVLKADGAQSQ